MGNALRIPSHEVHDGLVGNGRIMAHSMEHVGENMYKAGNEIAGGAHDIASAMRDSAKVGEDVAAAHQHIARSIPEAGIWLGGAGVCGSVWMAAGRNPLLTRHASVTSAVYAAAVLGFYAKRYVEQTPYQSIDNRR